MQKDIQVQQRRRPNIECLGSRTAKIDVDDKDVIFEAETGGIPAALLCFRNEAITGESVQDARFVTAHIVYRNAGGEEVCDVSAGYWLESLGDMVHLEVGKKKCLMIVFLKGTETCVTWRKRVQIPGHGAREFFVTDGRSLEAPSSIEVTLIDEHNIGYGPVGMAFSITDGLPKLGMISNPLAR